jgi:5-methyltetrahydropteroyltriglutamate--homocysteine methyltransferase
VIGSYPLPGWLEFACAHLDEFGPDDRAELQDDAGAIGAAMWASDTYG